MLIFCVFVPSLYQQPTLSYPTYPTSGWSLWYQCHFSHSLPEIYLSCLAKKKSLDFVNTNLFCPENKPFSPILPLKLPLKLNFQLVTLTSAPILFFTYRYLAVQLETQEVVGSTPAEVGNILSWRLIMKYFLRSFFPFCWFKKGSCQFLEKECAQYWLTS